MWHQERNIYYRIVHVGKIRVFLYHFDRKYLFQESILPRMWRLRLLPNPATHFSSQASLLMVTLAYTMLISSFCSFLHPFFLPFQRHSLRLRFIKTLHSELFRSVISCHDYLKSQGFD